MKTNKPWKVGVFAAFALACAQIVGCASSSTPTSDELNAAIQEASDYLNKNIPKGSKVVFLNIKSDYPDLSEYILSGISENAVNSRVFSVVDRRELDTIRSELDFQYSGDVSDDSAQAIGRMLGAQTIVSGAANKFGALYRIQVKAIEVQSAAIQGQWNKNVPDGVTIAALTERYAPAGTARPAQGSGGTAQTPAASAPTTASATYKVGDKGPAGGWIFYDKGNNSGGWRYLEAAPAENEFKAQWGNASGSDTKIEVGSGKANTQTIVAELQQRGEVSGIARSCTKLNINGYNDWFLPSKDELYWMYVNLKEEGIGGFSGDWYWSSSLAARWNSSKWARRFSDGSQEEHTSSTLSVRAVRAF